MSLEVPPPPVCWPLSPRRVSVLNTSINVRFEPLLIRNHYPTCISFSSHRVRTCRAMGSRLKSQESPTESSSASSIAFNCDAYSSKNWPYFLNCASPTISTDSKDYANTYRFIIHVHLKISNLLKEPSSNASKCHPSSILESSREKQIHRTVKQFLTGEGYSSMLLFIKMPPLRVR